LLLPPEDCAEPDKLSAARLEAPGFLTYCLLARPAERRIHLQAVEAPAAIEGATHS
jgi:hypothetical protein